MSTNITEPTPRTPRAEVRERILAAAEREFLDFGYGGASLVGIARRAGFTKGAVYSNFASKQALLAALLAERSARLSRTALTSLTDTASGAGDLAERAGRLLAAEVVADRRWNLLIAEWAVHAATDPGAAASYAELRRAQRSALAAALADAAESLGLAADTDIDGAAYLLVTIVSAVALEQAVDPAAADAERIGALFGTVVRALMGDHR